MSNQYTTGQAAAKLGLEESHVRRLIGKSRTVDWTGPVIGRKLGHVWLLDDDDIAALRKRPKPKREYKRKGKSK